MTKIIKLLVLILAFLAVLFMAGCGSPMERAIENGDLEAVENYLQENPKALNVRDSNGYMLLHRAAQKGSKEIVKMLIAKGAVVDALTSDGNSFTALHLAAEQGHDDVVELLIQNGADMEKIARGRYFRWTALAFASMKGRTETVKLLIRKGANVTPGGKSKVNPLLFAVYRGHKDIVELLLDNGAKLGDQKKPDWGLLHVAVYHRHRDVIELLLEKGADIDRRDARGKTPLHVIIYWKKENPDIFRLLLDKGADVNAVTNSGETVLHLAAYSGFINCAQLLLERGAVVDLKDSRGRTPLEIAEIKGNPVADLLLSLHRASKNGDLAAVSPLLAKYPQLIQLRDEDGKTPLYHAVENNRVKVAELLIANGADVNTGSQFERIQLLHGLIPRLLVPKVGRVKKIKSEHTPLDIANKKGYSQMARLLEKHGASPCGSTTEKQENQNV